jgi:hypothetical protein
MKINTNAAIVATVITAIAVIIFVLASSIFEPYKKTKRSELGQAAKDNIYLATDRWLESTGHKLRIEESGNAQTVADSAEDVVLIFASCFDFQDYQKLIETIKSGKKVSIFTDRIFDDNFFEFTEEVGNELSAGIESETIKKNYENDDDDEYENEGNDYFHLEALGLGILNVSDEYHQMQIHNLDEIDDAKEVWAYTGALDTEHKGIYIVRSKEVENGTIWKKKNDKTLWEILSSKGALPPMLLSILLLIVLGFWMCLLPIGKLKEEQELHGKSIRERFLAEGRFYKKHGLLNEYAKYFPNINTAKKTTVNDLKNILDEIKK